MAKKLIRTPRRWTNDTYVVDNSIVGVVTEDAFKRGWWAYGCLEEWEDTRLGLYDRETQARNAVEQWVKDHD